MRRRSLVWPNRHGGAITKRSVVVNCCALLGLEFLTVHLTVCIHRASSFMGAKCIVDA
ncbi:hypothetical protein PF003_g29522 [Phytophthora fragariae]|nr:hypothetical protein PF003_g29522 [Phytophthora fragariae]